MKDNFYNQWLVNKQAFFNIFLATFKLECKIILFIEDSIYGRNQQLYQNNYGKRP